MVVFSDHTALGNQKHADLATAKALQGSCMDMCPEKERYMREDRRRLTVYEIRAGPDQVQLFILVIYFKLLVLF